MDVCSIENLRLIIALRFNKGNYDAIMPKGIKSDLQWMSNANNLETQFRKVSQGNVDIVFQTDTSLDGWGGWSGSQSTGGRWKPKEIASINVLAIYFSLKAFCRFMTSVHIKVLSDITSAVAYINNIGGTKSSLYNDITRKVRFWCIERAFWLAAANISDRSDVLADYKSLDYTEWQLGPHVLIIYVHDFKNQI